MYINTFISTAIHSVCKSVCRNLLKEVIKTKNEIQRQKRRGNWKQYGFFPPLAYSWEVKAHHKKIYEAQRIQ